MKLPAAKTAAPGRSPAYWPAVFVCVFLVLAVLAVFGQTAWFGFVNFDDGSYVADNGTVTGGLSLRGAAWAFTHVECNFYHPLTILSLMLDYQLHGLHAGGYHLANVLFHAASAVLLFLILRRMTGAFWRSAFVAAVFAVHPLRAESVAWVAERKDVLATLFFMLTLGAWLGYVRKPESLGRYLAVAGVFVLGLLCKPTGITLPFVLLLLDYWPLGRMKGAGPGPGAAFWGLVKEKIPLFGLAAAAAAAAYIAQGRAVAGTAQLPVFSRLGNVFISYAAYMRQTVWPSGLAIYYPYAEKNDLVWQSALAFLLLALMSGWVLWRRAKRPWLLTGWFWYLGMLVPMIGLVAVNPSAHGDRNTCLPQIGLLLMLAWGVADGSAGWRFQRPVFGALIAVSIAALMVCAHRQTTYWKDSETLWKRELACTPDSVLALNNLGKISFLNGEADQAAAQYRKALERDPASEVIHFNLGAALAARGKLDEAIAEYQKSLEINPGHAEVHYNLGVAQYAKGDLTEAIAQFRAALALAPGYAEALNNLGIALRLGGDLAGAIAQFRKAVESKPGYSDARLNLGLALDQSGHPDEAAAQFLRALQTNPSSAAAHNDLGAVFLRQNRVDEAIAQFGLALQINPRSADTFPYLGMARLKKGEIKQAIAAWEQALEINSNQVFVLNNLAWLLATSSDAALRDGARARSLAERANQLSGGTSPLVLHALAAACAEEGNFTLAATTARRGLELASAQTNNALAATLQQEIKLYEAGTPLRDATASAR